MNPQVYRQPSRRRTSPTMKASIKSPEPPTFLEALQAAMKDGGIQHASAPDLYPTPPNLADEMARWALDGRGSSPLVLEPSSGTGNLVAAIRRANHGARIQTFEVNPDLARHTGATCADFMEVWPVAKYDAVVMNPPFSKGRDAQHVLHALGFLKRRGGRLVAIMSAGVTFRTDGYFSALRDALATLPRKVELTALPEGTFKAAGTNVKTEMLKVWG